KLIDALNEILPAAASGPKPHKDKPDADVLGRLLKACEDYDLSGVDAAMAEIEGFDYQSDGGLAVWLRENVDQMNFMLIAEKLAEENK
ncbi:MAG: hypothetical protein FWG35_03795, partial [Spirochaetaceae bacterium]|nr:hypothetical protein [Spirochaetaceae bacterium]